MQQASPRHLSIFHKLPEEIIVQILSFTDARTVGRFTACSSSCRAIVEHSSQIIYEALAIRHFTALTPCTAGDSGITIDALPDFLLDCGRGEDEEVASRTVAPVELDLRRAIVCQRTSSTAYDDVRTWKDFGEPLYHIQTSPQPRETDCTVSQLQSRGVHWSIMPGDMNVPHDIQSANALTRETLSLAFGGSKYAQSRERSFLVRQVSAKTALAISPLCRHSPLSSRLMHLDIGILQSSLIWVWACLCALTGLPSQELSLSSNLQEDGRTLNTRTATLFVSQYSPLDNLTHLTALRILNSHRPEYH